MAVSQILLAYSLLIISSASESFLNRQAETNDESNEDGVTSSKWFNDDGSSSGYLSWFNQEGNYFKTKDLVVGAKCKDQHCDYSSVMTVEDKYCTFVRHNYNRSHFLTHKNSRFFGIMNRREVTCDENEWLAGWKCNYDYCQWKMLYCSERVYKSDHYMAGEDCEWDPMTFIYTDWFSSDSDPPSASCPDGHYAIGLECKEEKYCPEMRIKCAAIGLPM